MLLEIKCDKFRIQPKQFKSGLNVVTGSDDGGNSIGKSTFLMIIDFVFGGVDYINKSIDVQKNIGGHDIYFSFLFNGKIVKYCRNTISRSIVYICDENYNKVEYVELEKYIKFLQQQYGLDYTALSFRNEVGRYFRIYGRENLQEKKPLHLFHAESEKRCVDSLLKLCDKYSAINDSMLKLEDKERKKKAIDSANDYKLINRIGKSDYKRNIKTISELENKIDSILSDTEAGLNDNHSVVTEEILRLKQELSRLRRSKSRNQYEKAQLSKCSTSKISKEQCEQLKKYFPEIELNKIIKYEDFHEKIKTILNDEITEEDKRYNIIIEQLSQAIYEVESQIKEFKSLQSLSKSILLQLATLQRQKETLTKENKFFEKYEETKKEISDLKKYIFTIKQSNLEEIEAKINTKMELINDFIYNAQNKAPIIKLSNSNYKFNTPDDTGTGTSYKSLIVFDLAILELTSLPVLVHDSYLLKQIQDDAIEKILELYCKSNKQVFISIDKVSSLTAKAKEIIEDNKILHLYPNGGELFGRRWNKK